MTIDFTRRRFLFGLAAVPLVIPAVKHFVMPKLDLASAPKARTQVALGDSLWRVEGGYNDLPGSLYTGRNYGIHPTADQYMANALVFAMVEKRVLEQRAARERTETAIAACLTA